MTSCGILSDRGYVAGGSSIAYNKTNSDQTSKISTLYLGMWQSLNVKCNVFIFHSFLANPKYPLDIKFYSAMSPHRFQLHIIVLVAKDL